MNIENPYTGAPVSSSLRGNLHSHTTASDGKSPLQDVINKYAEAGHDFLMISDHDIVTKGEDYAKIDNRGLILLPGNEVSRNGPHLLHVGAETFVEPVEDRQAIIDTINKAGGFAVINHPNWMQDFNHCSFENLAKWQNYLGLEIFNATIGRLDGSQFATDKWDRLLSSGRRVWGFANDDSHLLSEDVNMGWNMVCTADRSLAGIMDAFKRGCFYGSTGVTIDNITVTGNRIKVEAANADRIIAFHNIGREITHVDGTSLEIEVSEKSKYVRFECLGRGLQAAWTQPFHIS